MVWASCCLSLFLSLSLSLSLSLCVSLFVSLFVSLSLSLSLTLTLCGSLSLPRTSLSLSLSLGLSLSLRLSVSSCLVSSRFRFWNQILQMGSAWTLMANERISQKTLNTQTIGNMIKTLNNLNYDRKCTSNAYYLDSNIFEFYPIVPLSTPPSGVKA